MKITTLKNNKWISIPKIAKRKNSPPLWILSNDFLNNQILQLFSTPKLLQYTNNTFQNFYAVFVMNYCRTWLHHQKVSELVFESNIAKRSFSARMIRSERKEIFYYCSLKKKRFFAERIFWKTTIFQLARSTLKWLIVRYSSKQTTFLVCVLV